MDFMRESQLDRLKNEHFDLLVIGGGIVGASVARDAALRGLAVALIEKGDFASGTSSKTSKLIHGGLRYLEHGHLSLVRESLRERAFYLGSAPHRVWAASLLLPIYRGSRPAWKIRIGLGLYDWLSGRHRLRRYRMLPKAQLTQRVPDLNTKGLVGAGEFGDCQMQDARLCVDSILSAARAGAVCVNYIEARDLLKKDGRICGASAADLRTGEEFEVRARICVNAGGPWSDALRLMENASAERRIRPTQGIHLLMPRLSDRAFLLEAPQDGRVFFVLPWQGQTLIGTTETEVNGSLDQLVPKKDEVRYLQQAVGHYFPEWDLGDQAIIAVMTGARPLLAPPSKKGGKSTSVSREHEIEIGPAGLVSIMGGKYTTARLMAEQTIDRVVNLLGSTARGQSDNRQLLPPVPADMLKRLGSQATFLDQPLLQALVERYGTAASKVIDRLCRDRELAQPLHADSPFLLAEVVYAMEDEMACTLSDVLMRRLPAAWQSGHGLQNAEILSEVLQRFVGHTFEESQNQMESYRSQMNEFKSVLGA